VGPYKGMDRPGYYFIDPQGVIREKFFEVKYRERLTANNVMVKLFPDLGQEVVNTVQAPHLELVAQQSDRTTVPGGLITLIAEVAAPAGRPRLRAGDEGQQADSTGDGFHAGDRIPVGRLSTIEHPADARDSGARSGVRGNVPDQVRCESQRRVFVQRRAPAGGQDAHHARVAALPNVRQ
jgi:hypothetical protein